MQAGPKGMPENFDGHLRLPSGRTYRSEEPWVDPIMSLCECVCVCVCVCDAGHGAMCSRDMHMHH